MGPAVHSLSQPFRAQAEKQVGASPRPPQPLPAQVRATEVGKDHCQPTRVPCVCAAQRRDTQRELGFLILFIEEKKRRETDSPPLFLPGSGLLLLALGGVGERAVLFRLAWGGTQALKAREGGWLLEGWGCLKNGARLAGPSRLVLCCSSSGGHPWGRWPRLLGLAACPRLSAPSTRLGPRRAALEAPSASEPCAHGGRCLLSRLALVPALRASAWPGPGAALRLGARASPGPRACLCPSCGRSGQSSASLVRGPVRGRRFARSDSVWEVNDVLAHQRDGGARLSHSTPPQLQRGRVGAAPALHPGGRPVRFPEALPGPLVGCLLLF